MENVLMNLRNFARVPSWNTTMSKQEVEYLFTKFDNTVFCNGHLREIKADMLTPNVFKVYTIKFQ